MSRESQAGMDIGKVIDKHSRKGFRKIIKPVGAD